MATKKVEFMVEKYGLTEVSKDVFAGQINGCYTIFHFDVGAGTVQIRMSAVREDMESDPELQTLLQSLKEGIIKKVGANDRVIFAELAVPLTAAKLEEQVDRFYQEVTGYLNRSGYTSGSFLSGENDGTLSVINTNDRYLYLTDAEVRSFEEAMREKQLQEANKKERVFLGLIGATIGALIGGIVYLLIGMLGYWAWISSVIGYGLAYFGYRKFAGKIGLFGAFFSFFVGTLGVFFGIHSIWTWNIYKAFKTYEPDLDIFTVFKGTVEFLMSEPELKGKFIADVALWGGVSMLIGLFVIFGLYFDNKNKYKISRM
ncbi:MAG: hypothetical protein Q4A41_01665 [Bacillota bacterium]|nr:hypothetical protein [Bacillota bacterium]